jgi:hypothetical protein
MISGIWEIISIFNSDFTWILRYNISALNYSMFKGIKATLCPLISIMIVEL